MSKSSLNYQKVKSKYLKFLRTQEILSEPFRDKVGQLKNFYYPLSERIFKSFDKNKKTKIIGLTGGQGSGKSTISYILKIILRECFNLETLTLSIDDFYKTLKKRKKMSKNVSPLFLTRGVPGTHDIEFLYKILKDLKKKKFNKMVFPKFDKSIDDRFSRSKWQKVRKKPDIVIFEGWCVGVPPQKKKDLLAPINELEKEKDKKRIWRSRVNDELNKSYKKVFKLIEKIIFLKVPSFKHVYKWRLLQEKKLKMTSKGKKTMNKKQIKTFIMFYERLTKHMLKNLSRKANYVIKIDKQHRLQSIVSN